MPPRMRTTTPQIGKPPPPLLLAFWAPGVALVMPPRGEATGEPAPGEPSGIVSTAGGVPVWPGWGVDSGTGVRVGAGVNVGMTAGVALPKVTSNWTGPGFHFAVWVAKRSPIFTRTSRPATPHPAIWDSETTSTTYTVTRAAPSPVNSVRPLVPQRVSPM